LSSLPRLRTKPTERQGFPSWSTPKGAPFAQIMIHVSNASIIRKIALYRAMAFGQHAVRKMEKQ
jgi:hypothetical protein